MLLHYEGVLCVGVEFVLEVACVLEGYIVNAVEFLSDLGRGAAEDKPFLVA